MIPAEKEIEHHIRGGKTIPQVARILGIRSDTTLRKYLRDFRPDLYEIAKESGKARQLAQKTFLLSHKKGLL